MDAFPRAFCMAHLQSGFPRASWIKNCRVLLQWGLAFSALCIDLMLDIKLAAD